MGVHGLPGMPCCKTCPAVCPVAGAVAGRCPPVDDDLPDPVNLGGARAQVHVSWMDSGTAVFAFRGTESKQDGLQDIKMMRRNIDYLQRAYPGAKAHTGAPGVIACQTWHCQHHATRNTREAVVSTRLVRIPCCSHGTYRQGAPVPSASGRCGIAAAPAETPVICAQLPALSGCCLMIC